MPDFQSAGVGASVQTAEIDDNAVTTAKILDGAVTAAKLNAALKIYKTSGYITGANLEYASNYFDIDITAADLEATDSIEIELTGYCSAGNMSVKVSALNTTATGDVIAATDICGAGVYSLTKIIVYQDGTTNDLLRAHLSGTNGATALTTAGSLDTNDANVLTTGFTIRVGFDTGLGNTGTINYRVYLNT